MIWPKLDGDTLMSTICGSDKFLSALRKYSLPVILLLGAVVYGGSALLEYTVVDGVRYYVLRHDDPMISMRYARNLADGYGLRWNVGEPPVEGVTNLLWTLMMTLIHLLPIDDSKTSLAMLFVSVALLLMNAWLCTRIVIRLQGGRATVLASAILIVFFWPLCMWTMDGMEVGLISCLVSAGILGAFGEFRRATFEAGCLAAVFVALVVSRPDCILIVAVLMVVPVIRAWRGNLTWLIVGFLCSCVLLAELSVTAWRWYYYGEFLPNTFYLKAVGVPLLERLPKGLDALWTTVRTELWAILLLAVPGSLLVSRRGNGMLVLTIWALFSAALIYTVYLGGDTWERPGVTNRFISQVMSPLLVLVAVFICSVRRQSLLASVALLVLALLSTNSPMAFLNRVRSAAAMDHHSAKEGPFLRLRQGLWLRNNSRSTDVVAVVWAGVIPYFSRLPSYDILGKSDHMVARLAPRGMVWGHNKWSNRYVLTVLQPRFLQQLWRPTKEETKEAKRLGYQTNDIGILELSGSSKLAKLPASAKPIDPARQRRE
jgi:hypothetical protein